MSTQANPVATIDVAHGRHGPVRGEGGVRPVRAVLWGRRRQLATAAGLLTGHQLGEAAVPVVLGFAIDDALAHPRFERLLAWLLVLAANFVTLSLCWRFGSRLGARVRLGVAHDLRCAVVARALDEHGIAGDSGWGGGELLTVAVSDARRVGDATRICLAAAAGLAVLIASLVAVATVSLLLAVVVIAGAAATLLAVALLSHPVEARSHTEQEANASAAAMAVDLVSGLRVLAGLRAGAAAGTRYRSASAAAVHSSIRAAEAEAIVSGIAALAIGCYLAAVAGVSAELAIDGQISIGAVIAVLGLSQLLLGPLQSVALAVPSIRRGRVSAIRIGALLLAPAVLLGTDDMVFPAAPDLDVAALNGPGLDGLELHVQAGSLHGVVCDSPLAAESLSRALAGEVATHSARMLVGGIDLAGASPRTWRGVLLSWSHRSVPLGATVAEMVGVAAHGAQVAGAAVAAAAAQEILERIPGGWDAPIAEHGASLSGGERQRLALARVLAEHPPVLVLHEPTSAVDSVTEIAIANGIRRQRQGLTTVILTSSATLLAACDEVSLIVAGRRLASGIHSELLELNAYREVVRR